MLPDVVGEEGRQQEGYVSTDCRVGRHEDCQQRRIVPLCACPCHAGVHEARVSPQPATPQALSINASVEEAERRATLTVAGEIDLSNAGDLDRSIMSCVEQGCVHITLDMADVTFVDSTGIATLLRAKRSLPDEGDIAVVNASASLRRALSIKAVDRVIHVVPPEADAR
jgi:anti-sigma B factor antagonist